MVDMDSVASVTDTSAMVRMNASWQSKLLCLIVTRALGFSYHTVQLHRLLRSLSWRIDVAEGHIHFHSNRELTRLGQVDVGGRHWLAPASAQSRCRRPKLSERQPTLKVA